MAQTIITTVCPTTFSSPVPGSENVPGSTPIYRHPNTVNGLRDTLGPGLEDVDTLLAVLERSVRLYPDADCHGKRNTDAEGNILPGYVFTSYSQVYERAKNFGSGVKDEMKPDASGKFKLLGIMGANASEWNVAEFGCMAVGGTTVPLYTTSSAEVLEYLLNQSACAVVVCDVNSAKMLLKCKPNVPGLTSLIVYNTTTSTQAELALACQQSQLEFATFEQVEERGKLSPKELTRPQSDDIFSFIYTSGSTGMPKAALLSHAGQISVLANAVHQFAQVGVKFPPTKSVHLSYLPSAHLLERACAYLIYFEAGAIGYFQGKRETLMDDLANLRPTAFPTVPRLLNMIADKIQSQVRSASKLKQTIFNAAVNAKLSGLKDGKYTHWFWDLLVFNKIKRKLGLDRCVYIGTGSAPVSGAVLDFFRVVFGMYVVEGYGMSETAACATMTHPLHISSEHVGGPGINVELKLVSLPEMDYLVTDVDHKGMAVMGRGEVCIRGKCIMREYYLNPEATSKVKDSDGWYHTGDVGCILPNGSVKIFDRVSNVFKLSIGEYVAPEKIENVCTRSQYVASVFVHGDGLHRGLVAVAVLDEEAAQAWAKAAGLRLTLAELAQNSDLRDVVLQDLDRVCRKYQLQSYEIPKALELESTPWGPENLLTATQKMQRKKAVAHFQDKLAKMLGEPN
ncbi:hypothetical protein BASA81_002940 [Batrachochytrium salamandrivorans]|nr:hypothetical protein BASA81_002940 [Batrachochytrium salamandrivorans]